MTTRNAEQSTGALRPLDGLRILEVGGGVAANSTTKILGAFGAEIVKVEQPDHGDSVRRLGPFVGGAQDPEKGIPFLDLSVGKLSVTLDLSSVEGKAIFEDLCSTSAALVVGMSPSARDRLGIDFDDLQARHPDLVVCSVTSFGEDGPYRDRPASEIVIYGMGHEMHGTGTASGGPLSMAPYLALAYAGYNAAVPLAAALLRRRHDGAGEHIDFSIFQSFVSAIDRRAQSVMGSEYCGDCFVRPSEDVQTRYTRCKDGFATISMMGKPWETALEMMGVDEADRERLTPPWSDDKDQAELLERWSKFALTQGRYELSAELQRRGIAAAPVNTVVDLLEDEHLSVREVFKSVHHPKVGDHAIVAVPIRMADTPGRYETSAPLLGEHTDTVLGSIGRGEPKVSSVRDRGVLSELPLRGYRVIDLGVVLAGPVASMMLADLGADVIRVESTQFFVPTTRGAVAHPTREMLLATPMPGGGYPGREPGERPWNRSPLFNVSNRNKRGITMDLLKPEGAEPFRRLVELSDVIISNQTLRASKAQGIDYETVRKINPRIVYVSASLFGDGGPLSAFKGGGLEMEAFSGNDELRRYRDRDVSSNSWVVPSDAAGGVGNALGAILGLHARERTGMGQYIDLSLVENELALLGPHLLEAAITGQSPPVLGNRSRSAVQGCYQTAGDDHWLTLTVPDENGWRGLVQLVGRPEWADEPYDGSLLADDRHDETDVAVANWAKAIDRDTAVDALLAAGVWAGPVLPDNEIADDQQMVARKHFMVLDHVDAGRHRYPGPPYRLRESEPFPTRPSVRLGEHNDELYSQLLGFSDSEIEKLRELGHIGEEYAAHIM